MHLSARYILTLFILIISLLYTDYAFSEGITRTCQNPYEFSYSVCRTGPNSQGVIVAKRLVFYGQDSSGMCFAASVSNSTCDSQIDNETVFFSCNEYYAYSCIDESNSNQYIEDSLAQTCMSGQYRDETSNCVPIPDCNANSTNGGNLFDVNTAQCITPDVPILICIGNNSKFCPATNDCSSSNEVCTNNQADLDAHASRKLTDTPTLKTQADQSATEAAQAAANAQSLENAANQIISDIQADVDANLATYNADPTPENAQTLQLSIIGLQDQQELSGNVSSASASAGLAASNSSNAAANIDAQNTNPGIAENYAQEAEFWKNEALKAYQAALNNKPYYIGNFAGSGSGGSGEDTEPDAPDPGGSGDDPYNSSYTLPNADGSLTSAERFNDALNEHPAVSAINQIRALNFSPPSQCPTLDLDTTENWFGTLTMDAHCTLIQGNESTINNFAQLFWIVTALFIFLLA